MKHREEAILDEFPTVAELLALEHPGPQFLHHLETGGFRQSLNILHLFTSRRRNENVNIAR